MMARKNIFEKTPEIVPKHTFPRPVMDERGRKDLPPGKKGGEKTKSELHKIHKRHTFDSYCKKVLRHEAGNGHREISRRERWETPISELPEEALVQLAVYDEYPWEHNRFLIGSETVYVKDDLLAEALEAIPERERTIILMYWVLDMADREIAKEIGIARRTVNKYRRNACHLLKELMGGEVNG